MENSKTYLHVKDFAVTGDSFELLRHESLDMLITHPQPAPKDLERYYKSEDYISHTDTRRNLFERAYHTVRSFAINTKLKLLSSLTISNRKLLDLGCGTGDFLRAADSKGWIITGVEPNERAREKANEKTNGAVYGSVNTDDISLNRYGVITMWHVLEHLPDLKDQIELCGKIIDDEGYAIIAVPNFKSYDAQYYKSFWAAYDVPRHLWHFSRSAIRALFEGHGFELVKEKPMLFDAFYVSLLSEKYKTGSMNPIKSFWVGLRSNLKAIRSREYSSLIYIFKKEKTLNKAV